MRPRGNGRRSRYIAVRVSTPGLLRRAAPWLLLSGCAVHAITPPVPAPAPDEVVSTLLLIGDAGALRAGGEPVLQALAREAAVAPDRSTIVFLGDNVYPRGIPDSVSPSRAEAERRLAAQLDVGGETSVPSIFVPGNHDWAKHAESGWDAIRRQGALVAGSGVEARLLPAGGCPGPEVVDVGSRVRLVLLDTQWWLHRGPKPFPPDTTCHPDTEAGVADSLRGALRSAGPRVVIVAGHHPLASAGPHGGRFDWKDHLFPLRNVKSWLWLPLPVLGSLYPFARTHGASAQDFSSSTNRRMRGALEEALRAHPPLVYASGHEHALQVFAGQSARYLLVSGAGLSHHSSPVGWRPNTRYASSAAGFMRLDVLRDGRVRLGVLTVDGHGSVTEPFSMWLD